MPDLATTPSPRTAGDRTGSDRTGPAPKPGFTEKSAIFSLNMNEFINSGLLPVMVLLAAYLNSDHFADFFMEVVGNDKTTAWLLAIFMTGCGMVGVWELGRMKKPSFWAYLMVAAFMFTSVAASMVNFEDGFSEVEETRAIESAGFRIAEGAVASADANLATARAALDKATGAKATFEASIAGDSASDRGQQRRDRGASYQTDVDAARATFNAAAAAHASAIGAAQSRLGGAGEGEASGSAIATIGAMIGLSPGASRWALAFLLAVLLSCGILSIMYYATVIFRQSEDGSDGDGERSEAGPVRSGDRSGPEPATERPAGVTPLRSVPVSTPGRGPDLDDAELDRRARLVLDAVEIGDVKPHRGRIGKNRVKEIIGGADDAAYAVRDRVNAALERAEEAA